MSTWAINSDTLTDIADAVRSKRGTSSLIQVNKLADEIRLIDSSNTPLQGFIDNIDVDYAYDETTNANYTIIRVYKAKLDETKQYPFVYAPNGANACQKSTYEISKEDGWLLAINGGIFNTSTHKADGQLVENGVIYQDTSSATYSQCRPLVIDENGDMSEVAYNADIASLVANGAVSVICGFMAIIKDWDKVPQNEWNNVSHYAQNAQRQIIGQFGNGDYAIITCEGRDAHNSDGWTIAEAQDICVKHGLKFAYNLDGGGSTETMLGLKHFNNIYEGETGRKVPTFIVFNGADSFERPSKILSSISATKTQTSYEVGDTLSTNDIVVVATYNDSTTSIVTDDSIIDAQSVDMSTAGTYSINISYTEDEVTKTTSINITVISEPQSNFTPIRGYSLLATSNIQPYANADNRRIIGLTSDVNDCPIYDAGATTLVGYLIPIPSTTTKITVNSPSLYCGISCFNIVNGVITRQLDPGWSSTIDECKIDIPAGQYAYVGMSFKNSNNTNISTSYDLSTITLSFN